MKTIYIRQETANILEMFDDLLIKNGIKIPSPEDDEREESNSAALYGSVYSDLFDEIEFILNHIVEETKAGTTVVMDGWETAVPKNDEPSKPYTKKSTRVMPEYDISEETDD